MYASTLKEKISGENMGENRLKHNQTSGCSITINSVIDCRDFMCAPRVVNGAVVISERVVSV